MNAAVHTTRVRTRLDRRRLLLAVVGVAGLWEIAAQLVAHSVSRPDQVLPTLGSIAGEFRGLSDYWPGGLGVEATADGGDRTLVGAVLALGHGTLLTAGRLLAGFAIAIVVGGALGLCIGFSSWLRRFALGPIALIAALPLLALVPLFAFWFGATTKAAVLFVALGSGITILRATVNAIDNVPERHLRFARTMGASRLRTYRRVVVPSIIPELRGAVTIALTFSWSLVLSAELLGVQDGLGSMMGRALEFSQVGRMALVAAVFVALAGTTVVLFGRLTDRILRWAP